MYQSKRRTYGPRRMPFGPYRGRTLDELDDEYLKSLPRDMFDGPLKREVYQELGLRFIHATASVDDLRRGR